MDTTLDPWKNSPITRTEALYRITFVILMGTLMCVVCFCVCVRHRMKQTEHLYWPQRHRTVHGRRKWWQS